MVLRTLLLTLAAAGLIAGGYALLVHGDRPALRIVPRAEAAPPAPAAPVAAAAPHARPPAADRQIEAAARAGEAR